MLVLGSLARSSTTFGSRAARCSPVFAHIRSVSLAVAKPPYKILFCGTDAFAAKNLEALLQHRSSLCPELHVLTPPDVEQKWGARRMRVSPVKTLALRHDLPYQAVPAGGMAQYSLPSGFVDPSLQHCPPSTLLLTCSFGHMIPDKLLKAFPLQYQRLNVHPSLLPALRGAAPIQWAISRRYITSGISVQSLESRVFDSGRILAQQQLPFPPPEMSNSASYLEIESVMADHAANTLIHMLQNLPDHVRSSWEQDPTQVSRAPKIKMTDCRIDFGTMNADQIWANYKAFSYLYRIHCYLIPQQPGFPDLETTFYDVDVIDAAELQSACFTSHVEFQRQGAAIGSALYSTGLNAVIVKCKGADRLLRVRALQGKGKKIKRAQEWWTSYRDRTDGNGIMYFA